MSLPTADLFGVGWFYVIGLTTFEGDFVHSLSIKEAKKPASCLCLIETFESRYFFFMKESV